MDQISNELAALNWAPAKPESNAPRTGEEQRFRVATTERRINNSPLDQLKEVLRLVMVKVGLRAENWPDEHEKSVLLTHIVGQYGNHTHAEILLAFDMALEGKLTVDPNSFENFSCLYFSRILNEYRKWATETHRRIMQPEAAPVENKPLSEEMMQDWLNSVTADVMGRRISVEFIPLAIYDWIDKQGWVDLTPAQKRHYLERAVGFRQAKLAEIAHEDAQHRTELTQFNRMKEAGVFEGDEVDRLKNLAKKLIVWDYIITSSWNGEH